MEDQTKLAITAIVIYIVISSIISSPTEPEDQAIHHRKSVAEMRFDNEMDTYGGYDNYMTYQNRVDCLDYCDRDNGECEICGELP